jgi:Tfp pilus assembly protein PilF
MSTWHRGLRVSIMWSLVVTLAGMVGCAMPPTQPGLTDLLARPAERSLLLGLRAYDDALYAEAEKHLTAALRTGLVSARDQASAHKHLAFIYCTSERLVPCEQAFVAARRADAAFALTRSEAGHPVWGPVYRRVLP